MKMAKDPERKSKLGDRDEPVGEEEEVKVVEEVSTPDHPPCTRCGWHNTRLSHSRSALDKILRSFSIRAFRCKSCGNRFRAFRRSTTPQD